MLSSKTLLLGIFFSFCTCAYAQDLSQHIVVELSSVQKIRIYTHCVGEGPPVILIQGLGLDHTYWGDFQDMFAARTKRRVCSFDRPGYGQSDMGYFEPYDLTSLGSLLHALMIELSGDDMWTLVGHSIGGLIALGMAMDYPDWVSRIILIESTPPRHPEVFKNQFGASFPTGGTIIIGMRPEVQRELFAVWNIAETLVRRYATETIDTPLHVFYSNNSFVVGRKVRRGSEKQTAWIELQESMVAYSTQANDPIPFSGNHVAVNSIPEVLGLVVEALHESTPEH